MRLENQLEKNPAGASAFEGVFEQLITPEILMPALRKALAGEDTVYANYAAKLVEAGLNGYGGARGKTVPGALEMTTRVQVLKTISLRSMGSKYMKIGGILLQQNPELEIAARWITAHDTGSLFTVDKIPLSDAFARASIVRILIDRSLLKIYENEV